MKNALEPRRGSNAWSPVRELSSLQRGIDRLFENVFSSTDERWGVDFNPACDIEETDTHYLVTFDLPGVSKDELSIELRDNQLYVSGEKKYEHVEDTKSRHVTERNYGRFERMFTLPSMVDSAKVEATYDDGVLRIAVPKAESAKARQVKIGEGKGGYFDKLLGKEEKKSTTSTKAA